MRILLANHAPFDAPEAGPQTRELADRWREVGERARCLIVDRGDGGQDGLDVQRVRCRPDDPRADLPFDVPCLTNHAEGGPTFSDLTDHQVARYRDALRRALDTEIAGFNPHVIHVQHIWLTAHLALEAGVPYVLTAYGPELAAYQADPRFRRFADEAAENAGRIVAASDAVRRQVIATFGYLDGRIVQPPASEPKPVGLNFLRTLYHAVLIERFGAVPDI
ncbi:MAG TPA: glycosyltransferase [Pirellulales bacterium]|nr:glycosyltransferase [Pirellulales bacterium]